MAHSSALAASAPCIEPTTAILHLEGCVCTGGEPLPLHRRKYNMGLLVLDPIFLTPTPTTMDEGR
jgi:hypothetical protein